jgi:hypothetical protein
VGKVRLVSLQARLVFRPRAGLPFWNALWEGGKAALTPGVTLGSRARLDKYRKIRFLDMSQAPPYKIDENVIPDLESALQRRGLRFECFIPNELEKDQRTMLQAWNVIGQNGRKATVYTLYDKLREKSDSSRILSMGTGDGKKGVELLRVVDEILLALGAVKVGLEESHPALKYQTKQKGSQEGHS